MKSLVEVIWLDAVSGTADKENIKEPKNLLIEQRTYGRI